MVTQIRAIAVLTLLCCGAWAQDPPALTVEPDHVLFNTMEDAATITVSRNGEPLPSRAIKSARVFIKDSDYSHHFIIKKSNSGPATITLSPNPKEAQVGTFTLIIATRQGDARVAIDMPLEGLPDTLENRAKAEGVTVEEKKLEMGLSKVGQRETIAVRMPQWQYEGSTFTLKIPATPGLSYTWQVDGTTVLEGKDQNVLKRVLSTVGDHHIDMIAHNGEAVVGQWAGVLRVIPYPEMTMQVRAKRSFTLRGSSGYATHQWKIDGRDAGRGETFKHTFKEKGVHTVECLSTGATIGAADEFRRQSWKLKVL